MKLFVRMFLLAVVLAAAPLFAQEAEEAAPAPEAAAVIKEDVAQPKELSIYGEVQAVNAAAGSLIVQYYDYDSDEEKKADIVISKDTKLENASSINDVKKGDWVDLTYALSDGKNMASSIAVEKEEAPEDTMKEGTPVEVPEEE